MRSNRYPLFHVWSASNWPQGTHRVGNAEHVTFPRRVQLAVLAHIRHVHTDYERLLKTSQPWFVTRLQIEPSCLRFLLKWRGEDDEVEIEERTEEVVVLEDSDSEDDELDYYSFVPPDSPEPEIVSWKHQGREVGPVPSTQPIPQQNRPLHRKSLSANAPL